MKKIWKYCLILITMNVSAQNLVPNPSFEDMDYCPTALTQIDASSGWNTVNAIGTPDYFNICSTTNGIAPPSTYFAYQSPLTGYGFVGIVSIYYPGGNPDYREFFGSHLINSLQIGTRYFVSFYVSRGYALPQHYILATNKFGALFSTVQYSITNPAPEVNFAHVYSDSIISDTLNWVLVQGSFIADSAYSYINIGNFFDNAHTDTLNFGDSLAHSSYYLIENVCVSIDSFLCNSPVSIIENASQDVTIYNNPVSEFLSLAFVSKSRSETIFIRDLFGQVYYSQVLNGENLNLTINCSPFPNGIYLLEIKNAYKSFFKKVIVSHY